MQLVQVLIIIFALFAFSRSVLRAKDRAITKWEFLFWSGIWISIIIVALLPDVSSFFARSLGIQRGVDIALYSSVIVLFYLIFRLYVKLDKIEQDITKVVREITLPKKKN